MLTPPLRLRLLLLASLALAVEGCRPTFTCDPSPTATTTCHAHWACTFTLCSPGQTCTMPFYIDNGIADVAGTGGDAGTSASFNFSSAAGSLRGGRFGGRAGTRVGPFHSRYCAAVKTPADDSQYIRS
jgi:hypothetical protein